MFVVAACQGVQNRAISTKEPQNTALDPAFVAQLNVGVRLLVKVAAPLRGGPSKQDIIRESLPQGDIVTIFESAAPDNQYLQVSHHGLAGWVLGSALSLAPDTYVAPPVSAAPVTDGDSGGASDGSTSTTATSSGGGSGTSAGSSSGAGSTGSSGGSGTTSTPPKTLQDAISRAQTGVGFSYWWGGGAWLSAGATTSSAGTCSGTCPNCTHGGDYGADCSGYVAKIWQVPDTNNDLSKNSHPYSTVTFNSTTIEWSTVDRSQVKAADAYVYNTNGEGHIFLYSSGDAFGAAYTYEARGCAPGIVYNLRTITSGYKAIRRAGW